MYNPIKIEMKPVYHGLMGLKAIKIGGKRWNCFLQTRSTTRWRQYKEFVHTI